MDEYISRDDVLQALCNAVHGKDEKSPCSNQVVSCLWTGTRTQEYAEEILKIPAAGVRPVVRGNWKPNPRNPYWLDCTVCGYAKPERMVYNFCPNCGADMREVKLDEL